MFDMLLGCRQHHSTCSCKQGGRGAHRVGSSYREVLWYHQKYAINVCTLLCTSVTVLMVVNIALETGMRTFGSNAAVASHRQLAASAQRQTCDCCNCGFWAHFNEAQERLCDFF